MEFNPEFKKSGLEPQLRFVFPIEYRKTFDFKSVGIEFQVKNAVANADANQVCQLRVRIGN